MEQPVPSDRIQQAHEALRGIWFGDYRAPASMFEAAMLDLEREAREQAMADLQELKEAASVVLKTQFVASVPRGGKNEYVAALDRLAAALARLEGR